MAPPIFVTVDRIDGEIRAPEELNLPKRVAFHTDVGKVVFGSYDEEGIISVDTEKFLEAYGYNGPFDSVSLQLDYRGGGRFDVCEGDAVSDLASESDMSNTDPDPDSDSTDDEFRFHKVARKHM